MQLTRDPRDGDGRVRRYSEGVIASPVAAVELGSCIGREARARSPAGVSAAVTSPPRMTPPASCSPCRNLFSFLNSILTGAFTFLPIIAYAFLLSPFLLFPLAERRHLPPLLVPGIYLALWAAWEAYLHFGRPEVWLRADLFLIVPAQIIVLVKGIRRHREKRLGA